MDVTGIGTYADDVKMTLADLEHRNVVERIWRKDHSIWKTDPTEITNRLGWLRVADLMRGQVSMLQTFSKTIRDAGFNHVVLLGMGGSSLGAEVLRQVFSSKVGYPELIVLDSTIPSRVQAVAETIDWRHTLFLFSSKSGTTVEPDALFQYFWSLVAREIGESKAANNFVAITDPDSPLSKLATERNFRDGFMNPPDIGGRYSVMSYFGLVPAALIGIDVMKLLDRADLMRERCIGAVPVSENPGAHLGAIMATLALLGRDKLTIFASPSISSFGLWVEQLVAESTGKEGKGILPILGEPVPEIADYSSDRFFIYLRLSSDDNSDTDVASQRIRTSGLPVLVLEMEDTYDLAGEFYRWEFATAVAGAVFEVNPFDQPNVQAAKQATENVLRGYIDSGRLPQSDIAESRFLLKAREGDYLAVLAYVPQHPEVDSVMADFRRRVVKKHDIATTVGYGPRYLHSTGQLHKGGPNTGLFVIVTSEHEWDVWVPGRSYSFGVLADAQALGDFQALKALGRRVVHLRANRADAACISKLLSKME